MLVETQLAELENAQLVRRLQEPDLEYIFKHALTQETAYQSLLLKKRREIHRRVAEAYEQQHGDGLDEFAALLAQHYSEAGDDDKTIIYAHRAGDAAARIYANTEAVAHYALAIQTALKNPQVTPDLLTELYLKRGRCLELLSEFEAAAENYDQMQATANASGDVSFQLAALTARATVRSIPSAARDPEQARSLCDQALELAHRLGDRKTEAKILWNLLLLNIYLAGDPYDAVRYGEQSLAIARELNLREQIAYTLHDLFVVYVHLDLDRAVEVRTESGNLWRELHDLPMLAESLTGLGLADYVRGEFEKAFPLLEEAYQIALSIGNTEGQVFSSYMSSFVYLDRGEISSALDQLERIMLFAERGSLEAVGSNLDVQLGWVHAMLGDYAGARAFMERSLVRPWQVPPLQRAWIHAVWTRIELLDNNLPRAESLFREGMVAPSLADLPRLFPPNALTFYFASTELALARGESSRARELMDELIAHLERIGIRMALPTALLLRGRALDAQGARDAAIADWHRARSEAEAMGARMVLEQILSALAVAQAARDNLEEALACRQQACQVVEYIIEHAPAELRESFRQTPKVKAVLEA